MGRREEGSNLAREAAETFAVQLGPEHPHTCMAANVYLTTPPPPPLPLTPDA